jgi:hypothetical protein
VVLLFAIVIHEHSASANIDVPANFCVANVTEMPDLGSGTNV